MNIHEAFNTHPFPIRREKFVEAVQKDQFLLTILLYFLSEPKRLTDIIEAVKKSYEESLRIIHSNLHEVVVEMLSLLEGASCVQKIDEVYSQTPELHQSFIIARKKKTL